MHVRLASQLSGRWRADALVVGRDLEPIAEVTGISGSKASAEDVDEASSSPADSGTFGWRIELETRGTRDPWSQ